MGRARQHQQQGGDGQVFGQWPQRAVSYTHLDVYKRQPLPSILYLHDLAVHPQAAGLGPVSYTHLDVYKRQVVAGLLTCAALAAAFAGADHISSFAEDKFYQDRIVFAASSPYQRIVVTQGRGGHRLFLNGNLQFAERDEYRYHEALVHPVMAAHGAPKRVAVLGGGDGMAVREILKYPGVVSVTLVELDPAMTTLFTEQPMLSQLNGCLLYTSRCV